MKRYQTDKIILTTKLAGAVSWRSDYKQGVFVYLSGKINFMQVAAGFDTRKYGSLAKRRRGVHGEAVGRFSGALHGKAFVCSQRGYGAAGDNEWGNSALRNTTHDNVFSNSPFAAIRACIYVSLFARRAHDMEGILYRRRFGAAERSAISCRSMTVPASRQMIA